MPSTNGPQGGQIMDNAVCGGAGSTLTGNALAAVKAAIFMGDPHNRNGLPYNVGTCKAQGVSSPSSHSQVLSLTATSVRRTPLRIFLLARQHQHHPELLRLPGPILLQRKRRQPPPAVRQHLRKPGPCLHQEQAHCLDVSCMRRGGKEKLAGTYCRCSTSM